MNENSSRLYIYSPTVMLDGKGIFMEDPQNYHLPPKMSAEIAQCFVFHQIRPEGMEPLPIYEAAPAEQVPYFYSSFSLLWRKFAHEKKINNNLGASVRIFNFYCKLTLLLLLRMVLLPRHLIWCLSKPCVGFRCMCSSY